MSVYNLRNGLTIDLTFEQPTVLHPRPATLEFDKKSLFSSRLNAYPFPIDEYGRIIPQTNVIKMLAKGKVTGASEETLKKCALRFIQFIKVKSFNVAYAGKRLSEGGVSWEWQGRLLQRNLDCWVSEDGARDSAPFQFPEGVNNDIQPPDTLVARQHDTPGASIPLAEPNRRNNKDNYLWIFNDKRTFESIVAFVHVDKTIEMLEVVKWSFVRAVKLKWVKLEPEIDGTNIIQFHADTSSTSVFGKDAEYANTIAAKNIANVLTRAAMKDIRSSPDIGYFASEEADIGPGPGFWQP
jgi:hypothetical protein